MTLAFTILYLSLAAPPAEMHGRARTTVVVGSQPLYSVSRGALEVQRFAPIVEELSLDAAPGVDGVKLSFAGSAAIDPGERLFADPMLADLTLASIEWRSSFLSARAGRVFLSNETSGVLHLDGATLALQGGAGPLRLESDAWAGVPVMTAYVEEPLRDAYPMAAADPLFYAPRGSDWARLGDFAFGVRARGSAFDVVSFGAGYAQEHHLGEVSREAVSGHLSFTPFTNLSMSSSACFDAHAGAFEEAGVNLSYWPVSSLRTAVYARRQSAALLLPTTSIFSVFAGQKHEEAGLETEYFASKGLRFSASAELARTVLEDGTESAFGYRLTAGLDATLIFWPGAHTEYRDCTRRRTLLGRELGGRTAFCGADRCRRDCAPRSGLFRVGYSGNPKRARRPGARFDRSDRMERRAIVLASSPGLTSAHAEPDNLRFPRSTEAHRSTRQSR